MANLVTTELRGGPGYKVRVDIDRERIERRGRGEGEGRGPWEKEGVSLQSVLTGL